MIRIRSVAPALIAAAIAVSPAAASSGSQRVSFADLDLTTPAGIAELDARLERAVRDVCGEPWPRDLRGRRYIEQCRTETRATLQAQRGDALAQAQNRAVQLASRGR